MSARRILLFGVLALGVAAAGAIGYLRSIDFDRYRPILAAELRAASGRDVRIDGPVTLALLPTPRFVVSDVSIANAPWGTRDALARIERIEADIALAALLRGERRFSRVRLARPDIWFETDAVGKVNWILAGPHSAGGGSILQSLDVARFDIDGGRLTYRDGATGAITVLSVGTASVTGDAHATPLTVAFEGAWDMLPLSVEAAVGPINAVRPDREPATAVRARLETDGAAIAIDGTVVDGAGGPGAALHVSARVDDAVRLGHRFGLALPKVETAVLDARLRYRAKKLDIADATLTVGGQSLTGGANVDFTHPRPAFAGSIRAEDVDLAALLSHPAADRRDVAAGRRGLVDALVQSGALAAADGSVRFDLTSLRMGGVAFRDVAGSAVLKDGNIVAQAVKARTDAGDLDARIALDTDSIPPVVALSVRMPALSVGAVLQRVRTVKAVGGVAALAVNVTTVMGPPDRMLAKLRGEALLAMGEGRITLEPYEAPFVDRVRGPGSLVGLLAAEGHHDVALQCAASRMTIADGIARSEGFVLLSEDARVKGEGTVDLAGGTVALRFLPEALQGRLLVEKAVSLSGTLSAPDVALQDRPNGFGIGDAAFYPIRRFFAGIAANASANACLRALPPVPRKRRPPGRPVAQKGPPEAVQSATRAAGPAPPSPSIVDVQAE